MVFKGSNAGKSFSTGRDDLGIDEVKTSRKPPKGSGEQNISKGIKTKADIVMGKTKNTSGEAIT